MRRERKAKIVTTIGPASRESDMLEALFERGADVFRLNFSHGSHEDHQQSYERIRAMEVKYGRSMCILADIQGPKLRLGTFAEGSVDVQPGHVITLVLDEVVGTAERVTLPHPEIFAAVKVGGRLLVTTARFGCVSSRCVMGRQIVGLRLDASCLTARASMCLMLCCRFLR